MSEPQPQEELKPTLWDQVEVEIFLSAKTVVFAEGSWMCSCESAYALANARTPMRIVECLRCETAAVMTVWGGL